MPRITTALRLQLRFKYNFLIDVNFLDLLSNEEPPIAVPAAADQPGDVLDLFAPPGAAAPGHELVLHAPAAKLLNKQS